MRVRGPGLSERQAYAIACAQRAWATEQETHDHSPNHGDLHCVWCHEMTLIRVHLDLQRYDARRRAGKGGC